MKWEDDHEWWVGKDMEEDFNTISKYEHGIHLEKLSTTMKTLS
jgi:hypothetical protein